ncbi:MAG: hypothetical protein HQL70_03035 [Magnetococcales bacterium]|nr:hypothetical protein [Magnetococcales bacterium]
MAERDIYTSDQLAKIRETLANALGETAEEAVDNLDKRFTPKTEGPTGADSPENKKKAAKAKQKAEEAKEAASVGTVLAENKLKHMIEVIPDFKDTPDDVSDLVSAILKHPETKAFHLVDALSKIKQDDVPLIDALVEGITSKKGLNPLIDALRYAVGSPKAIKTLAMGIAEQGSTNHLIRAIATAPKGLVDAETIWCMEIMGKGSMEQLLEAMKLLNDESPGVVILAAGLINRKEVAIEPLVRALAAAGDNHQANAILARAMTEIADNTQIITLLEKYVTDDTEAAEIFVSKLVFESLKNKGKGRPKLMAKACGFMRADSMSGKILIMGIIKEGDPGQIEKAYNRMKSHAIGRKMVAVAIKNMGGLKAMKMLGGMFFQVSKFEDEAKAATAEANKRYQEIVKDILKEEV